MKKVLDLSPSKGEISYKKIKFPDGQVSLELEDSLGDYVVIKSRFNSYEDMIYILCAADILRNRKVKFDLYITCFLGQRSDRRFQSHQSFDLKILVDIISIVNPMKVTILHPHSDVLNALLEAKHIKVDWSYGHLNYLIRCVLDELGDKPTVISPDAGAYKWVAKVSKELGLNVIAASKNRDLSTGSLTCEVYGDIKDKTCLILDDYCDGGGTFNLLADKLRALGAKNVYLYITHGLFSKGVDSVNVDRIFTTNSISDDQHLKIKKFKV